MDIVYSIGLMLIGIVGLYISLRDHKKTKATFTVSYVTQIGGYFGYFFFILIGFSLLMKTLKIDWIF